MNDALGFADHQETSFGQPILPFEGDCNGRMGRLAQGEDGWAYETPDESCSWQFTAAQLRQIADKLDELNGRQG